MCDILVNIIPMVAALTAMEPIAAEMINCQALSEAQLEAQCGHAGQACFQSEPIGDEVALHVFYLDSLDIDAPRGRAILAHEVTHVLQYANGMYHNVFQCPAESERQGYEVQNAILRVAGPPFNQQVATEEHIAAASACP